MRLEPITDGGFEPRALRALPERADCQRQTAIVLCPVNWPTASPTPPTTSTTSSLSWRWQPRAPRPAGRRPTHADLRRRAPRRPAREAQPVVTADTAPVPAALCTPVRRQRQPSIHLPADDRGTRASCRLRRHPRRADQSPDKPVNPRAVKSRPAERSGRGSNARDSRIRLTSKG